jgi:hypothetical protein
MTQPSISNVVDDTVDAVDTEWETSNTSGEKPIIDKSDDIGKGRDLQVYDYVEFSKTNPTSIEYHDLPLSSQDIDAAAFVEIKSSEEDRRDELFAEFRRAIEVQNQGAGTFAPADFDRVVFADITFLDDDTFSAYLVEVTLAFEARGRSVET